MLPRGPGQTTRSFQGSFQVGALVLILAITAFGLSSGREATAQIDGRLLELLKKKDAKAVTKAKDIAGKKNLVPGAAKTAITPKNLPGKNVIGKGPDPKGPALSKAVDKGVNPKAAIGKGIEGKNATIGNDAKGTAPKSVLGKAPDGKGPVTKAAIGNTPDGKGLNTKTALGKGIDAKGPAAKSVLGKTADPKGFSPKGFTPKGFNVRTAATNPLRGATPVERLRLRVDHRRELLIARRLLPIRPLPGQRGFTAVPPVGETRLVPTEMVFRVGPNVSPQALDAAARRLGLTTIGSQNIGLAGGTLYHFSLAGGRQVADVIRTLETENLGIASANYVYRLFQESELAAKTDSRGSEQYVVSKLQLDDVHKIATGSKVLVAVIDSAIDTAHPDLGGAIVEQFDAVGRREKPHFHGTGMVGAIAAHRKLLGIAPDARILAVQAFSGSTRQSPEATTKQILAGLDWAIGKGARVINMSFAGPYDPMLQLAMKNAYAKGVVLIAAAGNLGPKSPPLYPAADPHVIAVTATDENDRPFTQAVRGPHLAVAAPGVDVMVPAPDETYQLTTGTSVAAAHVSGVAALLIERHPSVDAATILEVLTATAKTLSPKGRDDQYGWGLIDPAAALAELDLRMADSKVAAVAPPAAPKQIAAPKQATPNQPAPKQAAQKAPAPRLTPASAQ